MTEPALLPRAAFGRSEKDEERAGDQLMTLYGFVPIRFSQARATKQTTGISDRLYLNPDRHLAVWWEAKSATGKQRPAQARFQKIIEGCGMEYVLGPMESLKSWLTRTLEINRRAALARTIRHTGPLDETKEGG